MKVEENIYTVLRNMGFTSVVTHPTRFQKFINKIRCKEIYKDTIHEYWVEKIIDGVKYEAYDIDIWYFQFRIDGKVVFDKRRFKNEEILKLIPCEAK